MAGIGNGLTGLRRAGIELYMTLSPKSFCDFGFYLEVGLLHHGNVERWDGNPNLNTK